MWRNLILALLLANLLLFAWQRWIVPPDVSDPTALGGGAASAGALPELALLAKSDPISPAEDISGAPDAGAECLRVGPFAQMARADEAVQQLATQGFVVERATETSQIWAGYWVQLVDFEDFNEARRSVQTLAAGGLADAYVVQREPTINVSLGVFRQRAGADDVIRKAERLGFAPVMIDRYRPGVEHWVVVEPDDSQALDLEDLALGSDQILRVREGPCAGIVDSP